VALIGPNGAGKTTVFNCIRRFYNPDRGAISFDGIDMLRAPAEDIIRHGIARTFQNLELFQDDDRPRQPARRTNVEGTSRLRADRHFERRGTTSCRRRPTYRR